MYTLLLFLQLIYRCNKDSVYLSETLVFSSCPVDDTIAHLLRLACLSPQSSVSVQWNGSSCRWFSGSGSSDRQSAPSGPAGSPQQTPRAAASRPQPVVSGQQRRPRLHPEGQLCGALSGESQELGHGRPGRGQTQFSRVQRARSATRPPNAVAILHTIIIIIILIRSSIHEKTSFSSTKSCSFTAQSSQITNVHVSKTTPDLSDQWEPVQWECSWARKPRLFIFHQPQTSY